MLPPTMIPRLPPGTILDWSGNVVDTEQRPVGDTPAQTGRVRDLWLAQISVLDITPESLARMIRADYPLPQQMSLCSRMLDNDGHLASVYRDMIYAVSGLDWEILPFDDSPEAEAAHETCEDWAGTHDDDVEALMPLLLAGEFYPVAGAGIAWDLASYQPDRFVEIDPVRWWWDQPTNSLRLRTIAEPYFGEDLPPNEVIRYRSALRPGKRREGGLWKPAAWLYLFKHFTLSEWMEFAETFGKPFRVAYYQKREDRDSIYQAVLDLGANAAGVFPAGTTLDLKESNRTGTVDVYKALHQLCDDGMSELFVGHTLVTHARSGTGTLAGNGAQKVHEKLVRAMARRFSTAFNEQVLEPLVTYQHGPDVAKKTPKLKLKYEPAEDELKKAQTFVFVNQALQAVGEAIDPEQIRNTFNIAKTVPRVSSPSPIGVPPGGEPGTPPMPGEDPGEGQDEDGAGSGGEQTAASLRRASAASTAPIATAADVEAVAAGIGKKALTKMGSEIRATAAKARSIEDFMASVWEEYSSFDTRTLASVTRDAIVAGNIIGRSDAGE